MHSCRLEKLAMDKDLDKQQHRGIAADIFTGMSDGLTIPFALAAGLSQVVNSTNLIVIAGFTAVAAGSITMGFGGYAARKEASPVDEEHSQKKQAPATGEEQRIQKFFAQLGLSEEVQQNATREVVSDRASWSKLLRTQAVTDTLPQRAARSAANIAIFYFIGGLVPLTPFMFIKEPVAALKVSAVFTLLALFFFGWFKSKLTGGKPLEGALRASIIGGLAAAAAFFVASLFHV
jgi:VIT1/CCC1 family predicted Fe2+/Mn2+ transporter